MNKEKLEAIITANEYIDNLIIGIEKVSEKIYEGEDEAGLKNIPEIVEGLDYIYKVVKLTDDVLGNMEDIDKIVPYFNEIIEALESQDYILVGDLYKYEIIPILEEIKKAFCKVINN